MMIQEGEAQKIGSLCSGYGGLDMAVSDVLDARVAWHAELEPAASKILAHHWPDQPNHGDIKRIDWTAVEPVDVLTAGYPCQPFSHAGKRKGVDDERHLWPAVREAIRGLRPRLTVLENVAGHRSMGFDRVLGDMAEDGLHARWVSVRASDVGAAHRRERLFIVAHPADADLTGWEGREPAPRHVVPARSGSDALMPTPRVSDSNGAGSHGNGGPDLRTAVALLPTPAVNDMGEGKSVEAWDAWTERMRARHGNGNGHGQSLAIEAARLLPTPTATDAKASGGGYNGQANVTLTDATVRRPDFGQYTDAIIRWANTLGWAPPAPTVGGRLNPAFVEWMMGLAPGHVTAVPGLTRPQQLKALGNGVVPQQAAYALALLLSLAAAA